MTATGWSWREAENLPIEAYNALREYWNEVTPNSNTLIWAIASALGCKFGKQARATEMDAESLFRTIRANPLTAQKWNPKPLTVAFGKS